MPTPTMPAATLVGDLLTEVASARPDAVALIDGEREFTWAQFGSEVNDLAEGLLAAGVRFGDRVAMIGANSAEWIFVELAVARIGAVFMGLNTWYHEKDLEGVLAHAEARAVVCAAALFGRPLAPMVVAAAARVPSVEFTAVIGGPRPAGAVGFDTLAKPGARTLLASAQEPSDDDPAVILYTSGSTGAPKGVVLCHRNLIVNGWEIGERQHLTPADRMWMGIPLFFSFGSANALFAMLTHGVAIVLQEKFDPGVAVDLITRHGCTVYYGMAHMAQALLGECGSRRVTLPSLRTGLTIGPPEAVRLTAELVPEVCNVYGLTETYGNCAVTDASESLELRSTSQGRLLPGFEARAVNPETLAELPAGEVGMLLVKGRTTPGYFRAPEANAAAFPEPGWFRTGDLGSIDATGRLRYAGRQKEMLKVGGINVSPIDVEDAVLRFPCIAFAHVVGLPDPTRGDVPAAVIGWSDESHVPSEAELAELRAHCRELLPSYAVPVHFVTRREGDLPRTGTGKVRRDALVQEFSER